MFVLHRELDRLDLPAGEIFQLQRSLNRIQVALPGFPSQEAEAYLTLFAAGSGVRAAVALHLQTSGCLAIYLNGTGAVPSPHAPRLLEEGIAFAESMGFMLGDLDFPLLSDSEKAALWNGLPVKAGLPGREKSVSSPVAPALSGQTASSATRDDAGARKGAPLREKSATGETRKGVAATPSPERAAATPPPAPPEAAPEFPLPRTLQSRKRAATADEIAAKRCNLRAAVGKVLASL